MALYKLKLLSSYRYSSDHTAHQRPEDEAIETGKKHAGYRPCRCTSSGVSLNIIYKHI